MTVYSPHRASRPKVSRVSTTSIRARSRSTRSSESWPSRSPFHGPAAQGLHRTAMCTDVSSTSPWQTSRSDPSCIPYSQSPRRIVFRRQRPGERRFPVYPSSSIAPQGAEGDLPSALCPLPRSRILRAALVPYPGTIPPVAVDHAPYRISRTVSTGVTCVISTLTASGVFSLSRICHIRCAPHPGPTETASRPMW